MGNNSAFSAFEDVTLAVYDVGVLDKTLLEKLASCFRDQDADSGGYSGNLAKDGKDLLQIVASVAGKTLPTAPEGDYHKMTKAQQEASDAYWDAAWTTFSEVVSLN